MSVTAQREIAEGQRFAFGDNWQHFLELVSDDRIRAAEDSLVERVGDLSGKHFVDVGSGSGLFSLAARNLGAEVLSFDFDPQSVACTKELRRRYRPDDAQWRIEQGSALEIGYLKTLGKFDVVYSWGVLHHTGDMWAALENVVELVADEGLLFVAIYNDQGQHSRDWGRVKRAYNGSGPVGRRIIIDLTAGYFAARSTVGLRKVAAKIRRRGDKVSSRGRGMDRRRDLVDWVGGWPFEVAKPEQIFDFFRSRGFTLDRLVTCAGGLGNNEFVFHRNPLVRQSN